MLKQRLDEVEGRIRAAAQRAGRRCEDITLIAVTKKFPAEVMRDAYQHGLRHFGENYVQEFEQKAPELPDLAGAVFHLIGHLQSNKTRKAAELFQWIQTIDSARIATRLEQQTARPLDVMIEVKLSPEEAKHGTGADGLPPLIDALRASPTLRLHGLMTMPPWSLDPEPSRPYFRRLKQLADAHGLPALSMGMSNDFEVAIEEGATHIRIGTALFGPRNKA